MQRSYFFCVSENKDQEQRKSEEASLLRYEQYFENYFSGPSEKDWMRFLLVNSYVNVHSTWQTDDLKIRAESLSQLTLDYHRENSGYGAVLRERIINLENKRIDGKATTYQDLSLIHI